MQFDKEFFEGEIRNSFYVERIMKKVWAAELEVLSEVDRVCRKHNITYFAEWGTLLGAVRHKGFIPWDDDMDICMKRDDYRKFLKVAKDELPADFCVINIHTDEGFNQMLTRITNGRTIRFDKEYLDKFHGCPYVVGLDLFPMDYIAPNKEEDEAICGFYNYAMGTAQYIAGGYQYDADYEQKKEEMLQYLEESLNYKFNRDIPLVKQVYELAEYIGSMYGEDEAQELTLMPDHAYNIPTYRIPKECYASAVRMPFENTTIPVPVGYETILPIKYGENYMTPIIRRGGHEYPFFKEQRRMIREHFGFTPK